MPDVQEGDQEFARRCSCKNERECIIMKLGSPFGVYVAHELALKLIYRSGQTHPQGREKQEDK
jgi:hypothetical protein